MARATSIKAYNELRDSGALAASKWEIYRLLYGYGPATSCDIAEIQLRENPALAISSTRTRFTELRDHGLIREVGTRISELTGKEGILWDVTDLGTPIPLAKRESRAAKLEGLLLNIASGLGQIELNGDELSTSNCGKWAVQIEMRVKEIKKGQ